MSKNIAYLFLFGSFGWLIGFAVLISLAGAPSEGHGERRLSVVQPKYLR